MIVLKDLFSILTTGAYANTTFSGVANVLKEEHYEKVVNLINLGIVELYKRFKFLENEFVLQIDPSITRYYLRKINSAAVGSTTLSKYIEQPVDMNGFLNIVRIISAYDSTGAELRINNPSKQTISILPQIITLSPEVLSITHIATAQAISITYQAYPDKIVLEDVFDVPTYELNIPDVVIEPLVLYIAAKTFKPMGANDSTANADKSSSYEQQYELACQKLTLYGLNLDDYTERSQFDNEFNRNGWV